MKTIAVMCDGNAEAEMFEPSLPAKERRDTGKPPVSRDRPHPHFSGFLRDRKGAAAIEFAMVGIPFFMFVMLIFQITLYYFGVQSLDHATRLAARDIMLGSVASDSRTKATFKQNLVCANMPVQIDCDKISVAVTKVAASANGGPNASLDQFVDLADMTLRQMSSTSFCLGAAGDYIFLDVSYTFPNFLGSLFAATGLASDAFEVRATSFFRNEPFKQAGAAC